MLLIHFSGPLESTSGRDFVSANRITPFNRKLRKYYISLLSSNAVIFTSS